MARRKKFSNGVLPYRKSTNIYGDDEPLDDPKKVFLSDSFQEVMTVKFLGFNVSPICFSELQRQEVSARCR